MDLRMNKKTYSDEWYTPKYIFDALECSFDLDVASPLDRTYCSVPATNYITREGLAKDWYGFVWMNPPYSGQHGKAKWLNKLHQHGNGIALVPDSTSAGWWQEAAKKADAVLFLSSRVSFIGPDGKAGDSPSNGTVLFAYGPRALEALESAERNGLGISFKHPLKVHEPKR